MNPIKLILVIAEPETIIDRLANRDHKSYNLGLIEKFQNLEIDYAKELSNLLKLPIQIINSEQFEIDTLLNFLE